MQEVDFWNRATKSRFSSIFLLIHRDLEMVHYETKEERREKTLRFRATQPIEDGKGNVFWKNAMITGYFFCKKKKRKNANKWILCLLAVWVILLQFSF